MQAKLSGWKGNLLNRVGRVTLTKAVLTVMPVYHMQTSSVPQEMCDDMDRIVRNFVWKGGCDKGLHLVNWEKVTCPKCDGGLGLRQARNINIAMLGKLIAKLHSHSSKLWVRVMLDKYGYGRSSFSFKL